MHYIFSAEVQYTCLFTQIRLGVSFRALYTSIVRDIDDGDELIKFDFIFISQSLVSISGFICSPLLSVVCICILFCQWFCCPHSHIQHSSSCQKLCNLPQGQFMFNCNDPDAIFRVFGVQSLWEMILPSTSGVLGCWVQETHC